MDVRSCNAFYGRFVRRSHRPVSYFPSVSQVLNAKDRRRLDSGKDGRAVIPQGWDRGTFHKRIDEPYIAFLAI